MVNFKLSEILQIIGGRLLQGDPELPVTGISTDSRKIKQGDLFLALKGERFDGHQFLSEAVKAGAAALLVMEDPGLDLETPVISVDDTLKALGSIASAHRQKYKVPIIGITGSNGKTTTKDLVAAVLSQKYSIVKTKGNFNNEIGLPLTLLEMDENTEAVVVEMGMRGLGQISYLSSLAQPEIGIITNVGQAHLELLGSQANIAKAKAELIEALPPHGTAILNGDDPLIRQMPVPDQVNLIRFGIDHQELDYQAAVIKTNNEETLFRVSSGGKEFDISLPLPGRLNVYNALVAIIIGLSFNLTLSEIQQGLAVPKLTERRLKIFKHNQMLIIDDTYNASPASVRAALEVLCQTVGSGRKIAILADMLELGDSSSVCHREVGEYAAKLGVDYLFAYGNLAENYVSGFNSITPEKAEYFSNKAKLVREMKNFMLPGDSVLIKGSRGMKMEEIVEALSI
ncbi:MAG: UDP-N-acetylmuramoyl-tripeptide--D-alanyl-D-alanine ligase [Firmicutes bacterium]|nr:UDP-N-acetylmuramoyl-tripeptide--D-alanyl-D-alanine ligase [Bacillota bacterium]